MKTFSIWLILLVVIGAASLAVARYKPASAVFEDIVSPGKLSPAHAYLANKCESCHQTNVGVTDAKCTFCHANDEGLLGRQPTAFHAGIRECATCHVEHQNTNRQLIAMDHVKLAQIGARTLARASAGDNGNAATLKSLETWLRIRNPNQFSESSAGQALNCTGCHATKDRHVGLFGTDCAQCHALNSWSVANYQHPSSRSFDCAQCHQAPPSHYMMHFDMISKSIAGQQDEKVAGCCGPARVDQCYRCHQTTSWNDIRGVGYYKHH